MLRHALDHDASSFEGWHKNRHIGVKRPCLHLTKKTSMWLLLKILIRWLFSKMFSTISVFKFRLSKTQYLHSSVVPNGVFFSEFFQKIRYLWCNQAIHICPRSVLSDFTKTVTRKFAMHKKLTCIAYCAVKIHEIFSTVIHHG